MVQIRKEVEKSTLKKVEEVKVFNDDFDIKSESELKSIYISAKRNMNYTLLGVAKSALRRNYSYTGWDFNLLD